MLSSRAVHLIDESERNDYGLAERNRDHRCHTELIIGYADGRLGCGPACPEHHDEVSYSSGYREGRATRAGARMKPPRLRRLQRFKGAFDPVG